MNSNDDYSDLDAYCHFCDDDIPIATKALFDEMWAALWACHTAGWVEDLDLPVGAGVCPRCAEVFVGANWREVGRAAVVRNDAQVQVNLMLRGEPDLRFVH